VAVYASSAVHSAFDVGLERAKMTGALLIAAIFLRMGFVNACPTAATPISAEGFSWSTHSSRVLHSATACAYGTL
jgi:hypothetical protein